MSIYNTKQRRALLAFLGEHPDELLTARQMADALAEKQISLSAVYRNLAQLEAEEKVRRSAKSGSHEAFYQYQMCIRDRAICQYFKNVSFSHIFYLFKTFFK